MALTHLPNEVFDAHQPLFCHAELTRQGNDGLLSSKGLIFGSHAISPTRCADCEESEVQRTHKTVWTTLDNVFKSHLRLNGVPALLRTLFQHISGQRTSYCSGNGVLIAVSSPLVRIHTPEAISERIITSNTLLISLINSLASPSPHTVDNSICKIYCA